MIPTIRVRNCNDAPMQVDRSYVLYWMVAARRPRFNFALQHAADYARQLRKPLVVFEALRAAYPWASDRFHSFVINGMADSARRFEERGVTYLPYLEPEAGAGRGLLAALSQRACVVVTDDYPGFFLPRMVASAASSVPVRMEAVDSNGLLPMRVADGVFSRAFDFRRFLQKHLHPHLRALPSADPLAEVVQGEPALPSVLGERWAFASLDVLEKPARTIAALPIDHGVPPAAIKGGFVAGNRLLDDLIRRNLARYGVERNHPDDDVSSGLSPYLHFGHLSAHEIAAAVWEAESWSAERVAPTGKGAKQGWWKVSESAEAFLDELVTWRELGFNMAWQQADHDAYESLPSWAQRTLEEHASDPRDAVYDVEAFSRGETHDGLWNAAQHQLLREGRIHNYLRMLWGKNILAWSESPRQALHIMTELNNRYALDGRDPNSVSGIFWVLGRYDRAWGPERPVFGKVRYMTSASTSRKLRLRKYMLRFGADG